MQPTFSLVRLITSLQKPHSLLLFTLYYCLSKYVIILLWPLLVLFLLVVHCLFPWILPVVTVLWTFSPHELAKLRYHFLLVPIMSILCVSLIYWTISSLMLSFCDICSMFYINSNYVACMDILPYVQVTCNSHLCIGIFSMKVSQKVMPHIYFPNFKRNPDEMYAQL